MITCMSMRERGGKGRERSTVGGKERGDRGVVRTSNMRKRMGPQESCQGMTGQIKVGEGKCLVSLLGRGLVN